MGVAIVVAPRSNLVHERSPIFHFDGPLEGFPTSALSTSRLNNLETVEEAIASIDAVLTETERAIQCLRYVGIEPMKGGS